MDVINSSITQVAQLYELPVGLEIAFVRKCLGACLFPQEDLLLPPADLHWDRFHALLIQNKLVGLFHQLGQFHPGLWPAELADQLHMECSLLKLSGNRRAHQVQEVLAALQDAGLAVLVLKGWALIPTLYGGEYSQRPTADVDLMVNPGEADQVDHVLNQLGYRDAFVEPWPGYFRRFMNSRHYQSLENDSHFDQDFNIDIHWGIPDLPYYDRGTAVEPFFERSQSIRISGVETSGLAWEDALIYACSHITHHGENGSISDFYEIASIILRAGQGLNWEAIISRAATLRVVIPLQRILSTMAALWPAAIAPGIMEIVEKRKPSRAERRVDWWLVRIKNKQLIVGILAWFTTPGISRKFRYILETLIPGPDYLRKYYGPAPLGCWPLLYPRRVGMILVNLFRRSASLEAVGRNSGGA